MDFTWKPEDSNLTVKNKIGIGTDTPSTELDVIGSISATNLTLTGNLQLGALSINELSTDGNLADNSNLAVPTEQAVRTYVDGQITQVNNTRAALNGANDQDFAAQNLSVTQNLSVLGNLEVQGDVIARDTQHISGDVSLGDEDSDRITITGVVNSGHSSGALQVNAGLQTTGSVSVDGSLSVSDAIATAQLSVTEQVTGSLTIENNLTVGGSLNVDSVLSFNNNANRRVYGDSRAGRDTVVLDGHWDELEVKGRVIDWTGTNFHIGYQNDHSDHSLFIGNGKLKQVVIQGSTNLTVGGNLNVGGNISGRLTGIGITVAPSLGNEQTIKPPDGFTVEECIFFVALKFVNVDAVLKNNNNFCNCAVNQQGKVTVSPDNAAVATGFALAKKGGW